MTLQHQIDALRRQFQSGDELAREALQSLLLVYLLPVIRRAARTENAGSRVAIGIRRLAGRTGSTGAYADSSLSADDVCRNLCDELLKAPAVEPGIARLADTIRSLAGQTVTFGTHA
jgi:hypothetical protein